MSDLKIFTENIEPEALKQIYTLIKQPAFSECKVRIMPDVHAGAGCVIGFTADLGDKVIPNIVGVDIGCGILTTQIPADVGTIDFKILDEVIRNNVPSGRNVRDEIINFEELEELHCFSRLKNIEWIRRSLGTLGGGNHFIEVDTDSKGLNYLVIHTGSRNLGKQVAEIYQKIAIEDMQGTDKLETEIQKLVKEYKRSGRRKEIQHGIDELKRKWKPDKLGIPKELCYLTGEHRKQYLHDMKICQEFARINRRCIQSTIFYTMNWTFQRNTWFDTIHNYIDTDEMILRKGAIAAHGGEKVLIPINMRDGSVLAVGKGNPEWNYSAPHGAGRLMSRTKAKANLSMDEYRETMKGIYTTSINENTLDEAPMAYKSLEDIIDVIRESVDVIDVMKPIYNFKASD
mgnify:CR=1 FL=1